MYVQQQLCYDTAQVLHAAATLQLLTGILVCLGTNILLCFFLEVASCLTRSMTTLWLLHATYTVCLGLSKNHNFGLEFALAD